MVDRYEDTLRYLWGLHRLGSRPGLDTIRALLEGLGNPERTFRSIHVTGSKGKGSTSAFLASVLRETGTRTGLYTSPHLLSYRERVEVDGRPIPKSSVVAGVAEVRKVAARLLKEGTLEREPTFFEVTTALAFWHFRASKVETAVVEVGLGGRLDATNTIQAPVCVVTTLELEHTEIIGPTLRDIATEKAGIFHRGAWAVTGVEGGEGFETLRHEAFQRGVPLWKLGQDFTMVRTSFDARTQTIDVTTPVRSHPGLTISMLGAFQARNAGVAVAALDLWGRVTGTPVPEEALARGLKSTRWPGRLERVADAPPLYVDVAHTPESVAEVATALEELEPGFSPQGSAVLFSCLKDKRLAPMLDTLSAVAGTIVLVPLASERAMSLKEMELEARPRFRRLVAVGSAAEGLRLARVATEEEGLTLVTGSIYLVGEVIAQVRGTEVEQPRITDPLGVPSRANASATAGSR